jgi:DNA-directed RNA polymerase subunit RPC12/RpoP
MMEINYVCEDCDKWIPRDEVSIHKVLYPGHKIMVLERKP